MMICSLQNCNYVLNVLPLNSYAYSPLSHAYVCQRMTSVLYNWGAYLDGDRQQGSCVNIRDTLSASMPLGYVRDRLCRNSMSLGPTPAGLKDVFRTIIFQLSGHHRREMKKITPQIASVVRQPQL